MKKLALILAFLCSIVNAQIITHNISDDGYAHVPLQFPFPYYGRIFTDSYMYSNGVVGFGSVNNHWCCSGYDLRFSQGYQFNYSIMPLQTDLINYGSGRFLSEGTPQYQRYMWENISEYGRPNNLNTFGVEIRPDGFIGMYYNKVHLDRPFTIGMTGDTALGEYTQHLFQNGLHTDQPFSYLTAGTGNICVTNPLASPSCPNYQEAYDNQQCSLNPLYRPSCIGYEQAYTDQQCSINPLYSSQCSGYQQAYYNQQCSLNPLYDTGCVGYEAAYFNNQCRINPLYNSGCQGYAQAYFNYQCSQNPLYDRTCTGYAEAYALANVVPATSTTTVSTTTPSVQVSTTGTVTMESPVVADPVVNEVITRPVQTSTPAAAQTTQTSQVTSQVITQTAQTTQSNQTSEKKESKKEDRKEEKREEKRETKQVTRDIKIDTAKTEVGQIKSVEIRTVDLPKGVDIIDYSFMRIIANMKTIQENRNSARMMQHSDRIHRELIDGQWNR